MTMPNMGYFPPPKPMRIDLSHCVCSSCRPPLVTVTTTGSSPPAPIMEHVETPLVACLRELGLPQAGLEEVAEVVEPSSEMIRPVAASERASDAMRRPDRDKLIEEVLEKVDELLLRSEALNDKADTMLGLGESASPADAAAPQPAWAPPVLGDRVWSRSTGDGPFHVVLIPVVTDVESIPTHAAARGRFNGVDACVVRGEDGKYHTIPVADLSTIAPARQRLPWSFYAVAVATGAVTTIAGHVLGLLLLR